MNIFDKTTLHFSVKLRQVRTGYLLTLDRDNKESMFPPAVIMRTLQTRRIESRPYVFADLETPPQFDPTLLNTFLSNKTFSITLNVYLNDLHLKHQGNTFTLKYRKQNEAGYININTPHLDLTEARILDSARRTSSMHHRRQEYRYTDDYNGPRR